MLPGLMKSPVRHCHLIESDVVKVSGNKPSVHSFDLMSGVPENCLNFKYVRLLGVVISGAWHLPSTVSGGATIALMDKRISNPKQAVLSKFVVAAKQGEFQGRFTPHYSITMQDARKSPWEVFVSMRDVPTEDGWQPLTVEIAVLLLFTDLIVEKSLRAKLMELETGFSGAEGEVSASQIDEFKNSVDVVGELRKMRTEGVIKGRHTGQSGKRGTIKRRGGVYKGNFNASATDGDDNLLSSLSNSATTEKNAVHQRQHAESEVSDSDIHSSGGLYEFSS